MFRGSNIKTMDRLTVHKIHCGISDHGHHDLDDSQVYTDTIQVNLPKHDTCERACA